MTNTATTLLNTALRNPETRRQFLERGVRTVTNATSTRASQIGTPFSPNTVTNSLSTRRGFFPSAATAFRDAIRGIKQTAMA